MIEVVVIYSGKQVGVKARSASRVGFQSRLGRDELRGREEKRCEQRPAKLVGKTARIRLALSQLMRRVSSEGLCCIKGVAGGSENKQERSTEPGTESERMVS